MQPQAQLFSNQSARAERLRVRRARRRFLHGLRLGAAVAVLATRQVPTSSIEPGMVVLFASPGEHAEFAHRITSAARTPDGTVVTTKGDANRAADPWHSRITAGRVSEVVGSIPGVGRLLVVLRGAGQIEAALSGGLVAARAGTRWIFNSTSRPFGRRVTVEGA